MITPGRWPPVYDFDSLALQIKELVSNHGIFEVFYQYSQQFDPALCQGDIVHFRSPFPVIDKDGDISTIDNGYSNWVILGNTCDLDRDIHDAEYSHISPLFELKSDEPERILNGLKSYGSYKKFYIPCWDQKVHPGYLIDFTTMCSVHKSCLFNEKLVSVLARMGRISWLLLHSCIVRYLARDDGRHA
jgi:hypothetical protein